MPAAKVNVGAIATQARCNLTYRERGLSLLSAGASAEEVVENLVRDDNLQEYRQVGVVDRMGRSCSHTGEKCAGWAGDDPWLRRTVPSPKDADPPWWVMAMRFKGTSLRVQA